MKSFLKLLALSCLVGCTGDGPADTSPLPVDFRIDGQVRNPPVFKAEGGVGRVVISGQYGAGRCHEREIKHASRDGQTLTFRFELSGRKRGDCTDVLDIRAYVATIRGMAPGTYSLNVEHHGTVDVYREPNGVPVRVPDGLRLEQEVTVR